MKNTIKILLIISLIMFAGLTLTASEKYCHISMADKEIIVIKPGGEMLKGIVNLPIYAGDIISTGKEGRCEIQFSNGTIMRLDKKTELRIVSTLIDVITSKKKISTLKLIEGSLFSMNQVYKGEIFQVITPEISVKMSNRSSNMIKVKTDQTSIKVLKGKVGILYGDQKKIYLRTGDWRLFPKRGKDSKISGNLKSDFYEWNKKINKNFKDLHYGKSNVPDVIYRYSPGIVHFAEKWSTMFGEWEYTELFGYVWKPGKDIFFDKRPFFDASFVKVNGELILIPNQKWGWAPAHMGTWFWSTNQGWIWIPGNGENENLAMVPELYKAFMMWTRGINGIYDFFNEDTYFYQNNPNAKRGLDQFPWKNYYLFPMSNSGQFYSNYGNMTVGPLHNKISSKIIDLTIKDKKISATGSIQKADHISKKRTLTFKRDWNPDSRLIRRTGLKVSYNPSKNVMNYSKGNISLKSLSSDQKYHLRQSIFSGIVNKSIINKKSNGNNYIATISSQSAASSSSSLTRSGNTSIASTAKSGSSNSSSSKKK